jgi:hypothetical protein
VRGLSPDEHFSVDGTQVSAWASMKSFRAKDGSGEPPSGGRNGERDFHGETRRNDTHASTTDHEARIYRKGKGKSKEAKLSYIGNALTENRHGLVVEADAARRLTLTFQVHSDNGSLRPHPAAQIARGVGMTGREWSKMNARSAKSSAITRLGPERQQQVRERQRKFQRPALSPARRGGPTGKRDRRFICCGF